MIEAFYVTHKLWRREHLGQKLRPVTVKIFVF